MRNKLSSLAVACSLLCSPVFGQNHSEAKALFDSGQWDPAGRSYETAVDSGSDASRAEAAAFVLRSYGNAGKHDKVEALYDKCLRAAAGTKYEGEVVLERGKSIQNNAKNGPAAMAIYDEILNKFPNEVFPASGAMLQKATVLLEAGDATGANASFAEVPKRYPTSPFVDDSYVGQAKTGIPLRDLQVIDAAASALQQMKAAPGMLQKVNLERAEYMSKVRGSRHEATHEYLRTAESYQGCERTPAAAFAKVRAADLVPADNFRRALGLYEEAIASNALQAPVRDWAKLHCAIYKFQMHEAEGAVAVLEEFLASTPHSKHAAEARRYLNGIKNPETTDGLTIVYDRALRNNSTGTRLDSVFWDMQDVVEKTDHDFCQQYLADTKVDAEDRAQMLYRKAFAYYHSGEGRKAFDLAQQVLDEFQPKGVTRHQCLALRAHLMARCSDWQNAVPAWRALIDENPKPEMLTLSYLEYSRALDLGGDELGAILALEELIVRFPHSRAAEQAAKRREMLTEANPSLVAPVEQQRPLIVAKWKGKTEPLHELAGPIVPTGQNASVGGAE